MNDRVFGDPKRRPTAKAIASALGKASAAWVSLFTRIHEEHPTLTEEWRYYDDGKSWLLKVSRKSKTVFWGSVTPGKLRLSFYTLSHGSQIIVASNNRDLTSIFFMALSYAQARASRDPVYFPDRLTPALLESDVSDELKETIRAGEPTGKLRGVRVELGPKRRVADVMRLITLKTRLGP